MKSDIVKTVCGLIAAFIVIFAISGTVWVVKSHFEAKTYTKLTGKQVGTWDAMWVQLRVIEPAQR